ncbi:MAG: 2Fe-2S ferredoxin [Rhodocyclaceae bacterium]|nr:MAG: 2Fe-2S ferredoxin [Rhodocyclaceae bacterium]
MAFEKLCTLDDIWEGDMDSFDLGDTEILLVWPMGGEIKAYQGVCPHQDIPLSEGKFDGKTIMCKAHQWTFDANSGRGINPGDCKLAQYPVKVEEENVLVETSGITPLYAHS